MSWISWAIIAVIVVMLIIDWLIVMGKNPKKWKGGHDE